MKKISLIILILACCFIACGTKSLKPVTPLDGEEIAQLRPYLEWETAETAQSYELQLSTDSSFNNLIIRDEVAQPYYNIEQNLENNSTYYWRVRIIDNDGNYMDWGEPVSFKISLTVDTPNIVSPLDGNTVEDKNIMLKWENIKGVKEYELQVDYYQDFSGELLIDEKPYGPQYTISKHLSSGTYYWRVRAMDLDGNWGAWSETGYFYYINPEEGKIMKEDDMGKPDYSDILIINYYLSAPSAWDINLDVFINDEFIANINGIIDWEGISGEWEYYDDTDKAVIEVYGTVTTGGEEFSISHIEERDYLFDEWDIWINENGEITILMGGACPWLYIWNDTEYLKQVEIIQNLFSESLETTQVAGLKDVYVENGLVKLKVCEEKDELSYIDEIVLIIDGHTVYPVQDSEKAYAVSYIDHEYLVLKKGDTVEFFYEIPVKLSGSTVWMVRSTGYYIPEP